MTIYMHLSESLTSHAHNLMLKNQEYVKFYLCEKYDLLK